VRGKEKAGGCDAVGNDLVFSILPQEMSRIRREYCFVSPLKRGSHAIPAQTSTARFADNLAAR